VAIELFATDSYVRQFEAWVTATEGQWVALDRTAFYPTGGGQPHDTGELRSEAGVWQVTDVSRRKGEIWHCIEGVSAQVGAKVSGVLDWERRYRLMRTHTAMHILCGVVWRHYGALVTGGSMQPLAGRMDFEFESLRGELVREIERRINAEVAADRRVTVDFLPREVAMTTPDLIRTKINLLPDHISQVRTVEVEGLDLQADGGTHVARTGEVGPIRIAGYRSKGRINKRLEIELAP
jgi:misacylated tRNA(Ala) deacylase